MGPAIQAINLNPTIGASGPSPGGIITSYLHGIGGTIDATHQQAIRYQLGWNDLGRQRAIMSALQRESVVPRNAAELRNGNVSPVGIGIAEAIRLYNSTSNLIDPTNVDELAERLAKQGVAIKTIDPATLRPANGELTAEQRQAINGYNSSARAWQQIVSLSATAAPLGQVIHDWWRGGVTDEQLDSYFERGQVKKIQDRFLLRRPYYHFSVLDAYKLYNAGLIDGPTRDKMLGAAGMSQEVDQRFAAELLDPFSIDAVLAMLRRGLINQFQARQMLAKAGVINQDKATALLNNLQFEPPPGAVILNAVMRQQFDDQLAAKYQLDDGSDSGVLSYWMRALGLTGPGGSGPPGAQSGPADWQTMYWRSSRPLADFNLARELQHRLRPQAPGAAASVVPGAPAWTGENTRDMLRMAGWSPAFVDRLMGMAYEPVNIRLINHILGPYSTHPEVKAAADAAFGAGVNWVEGAMLDHGFAPAYARVAAVGIQAQADDRDNEERKSHERRLRMASRKQAIEEWERGLISTDDAVARMTDPWYTQAMARQELTLLDRDQAIGSFDTKLKSLRTAYIDGKISADEARARLVGDVERVGRIDWWLTDWQWERSERTRMLATGEILGLLKQGLMSPDAAAVRLINLGWAQADALIEVAQVEHELALAQAKTQQHALEQQQAEARKLAAERAKAQAKEQAELVAAGKARDKLSLAESLAMHKSLLARSEYFKDVHLANAAYAKADAKHDQEKMDAELQREVADYERWLIEQIHEMNELKGSTHVTAKLDTQAAPGPGQGAAPAATPAAGGTAAKPTETSGPSSPEPSGPGAGTAGGAGQ